MMKFSARSSTKVLLLTTCNYYDLLKIPKLLYNDRVPLIAESSMTLTAFNLYFDGLVKMKNRERIEVIGSGWI